MSPGKQQESVCRYFRLSQYVCSWQWVTTWDGLKHHGMPITILSLWQENIVSQQRLLKGLNDYDEPDVLLGFLLLWKTLTKPTWRPRSLFSLHFGVLCHWGRSGQELKGGIWKQGQKQRLCCCLVCLQAHIQVLCIHILPQRPVVACSQWVEPFHITQQTRNCPISLLTGLFDGKKKSHLRFTLPRWFFLESSWTKPNQYASWPEVYGGGLYKYDLIVMQISLFLGVCVCV